MPEEMFHVEHRASAWEQFLDRLSEFPAKVEFIPFEVARQCGADEAGSFVDRAQKRGLIRWVRIAIQQSAFYVKDR